ncbi:hydantoinase/oxoprolinase family protein [Frondihabitans sp. PAMC 28766]|uniref:hydantoinase/oxoprolinase family protein n=1 Tax=Frondihabitans sp. PAMC 28766 TaxID=1795630 RepID=UPI000AD56BE6|nr:hydantoinase/oxoprolinase family protein [Frondihabitans sp. PAMC 28766]
MATPSAPGWRLAVDVGGTFIDYILLEEATGRVTVEKQPATATSLAEEFATGVKRLPVGLPEIDMLIHGTTVALNTLVQERGARTGLLTTHGFRDVLELGRGGRPELYNLRYLAAEPLVPRYLRRELHERVLADGTIRTPLDLDEVRREVEILLSHGVEAIAVVLLHSYRSPGHENTIAELVRAEYPGISVSVSSELIREWREYERTSTTVINAFTQPAFEAYASQIDKRTRQEGLANPIAFMRSNGGVIPIADAQIRPVETLGSGPAGGVVGARQLMQASGYPNVVCADVGGTTYDVALITDGEIVERADTIIEKRPIMGQVIDIISVGAGGGSIARLDKMTGSLQVGPESAGAFPGPACFDRGGKVPTVTDAQVVLGLLDPDNFLGGRMKLRADLATEVIDRELGPNHSVTESAAGILAVAQANMANAIRQITTQRGLDPREFAMLSYGGGGGLFAAGVSEELGITTVIVPQAAAGFSAWGMLNADYRDDASMTARTELAPSHVPAIRDELEQLRSQTAATLRAYGFADDVLRPGYSLEVRYLGQEHTIDTPVRAEWLPLDDYALVEKIKQNFVSRHRQRFGHGDESASMEVVVLRCRNVAPVLRPMVAATYRKSLLVTRGNRRVWFPATGWDDVVPVYNRDDFGPQDVVIGPAIVDEWTTTVIVPPAWTARIDALGNIILEFRKSN